MNTGKEGSNAICRAWGKLTALQEPRQYSAPSMLHHRCLQALEKKEGLFRMNMMGKRVNFAAR